MKKHTTYTADDGRKYVFRKPTRPEYELTTSADADKKPAAFRVMILDCFDKEASREHGTTYEDACALLDEYPALVLHAQGIGAELQKMAGAGLGSFS